MNACPNWGLGPCGHNDLPCARGCKYVPGLRVQPHRVPPRPKCAGCGQALLLVRDGRTRCERCRLNETTA